MSSTRPDMKFSDNLDERQYYRKYSNLAAKDANTIRVIDHNKKDYFTVLDENADLIAENIYKTQSVIKYNQSRKNRYVTLSPAVFTNNVLKFCLVDRNMKVEIYNNKSFELICLATPGNLEAVTNEYGVNLEGMFNDCSSPIMAAVRYQQSASCKRIGVCTIDLSNSTINVSEFDDNDLFSNLESILLQMGVKEVILPSNYTPDEGNTETIKLNQVLNRIGNVVISTVKSSFFTSKDIEQDLAKIVVSGKKSNDEEEQKIELILASKGISTTEFDLSLSCCNALINYLELMSDVERSFTINQYNLSSYMKLDSSTTKALNIFPESASAMNTFNKTKNISSIFELLNKCKTPAGSRLLSQFLKQPLTSYNAIRERQDLVSHLIDDTNLRVFVSQEWLTQVPDIKRLLKKISNAAKRSGGNENKKLEDVVRLYQLVLILPELIDMLKLVIEDNKDKPSVTGLMRSHWLEPLESDYSSLVKYQELVETTVDLTPLSSNSVHELMNTDFNIKPEFDESLVEIDEKLQSTLAQMKEIHEDVGDDLNMELDKKLKLENTQQHGWCFRVTRNDSAVLRNTGNTYSQLQTVKAGVFFTTKKLSALSTEYAEATSEYNSKQRELIKEILAITLTYQSVFTQVSLTLAHIDVLSSFANVAIFAPIPFVMPTLHPLSSSAESDDQKKRCIKLKESRHPVLEAQDDINFIANDVLLSNDNDVGKSFAIITGPNMGGKSTYIRQVGVLALMAQVGSFIPASDEDMKPELPIFDAILSRVGAGDSQLKGLSTFMIEMLETSSILATATHNSLIIIDELGRGTSTYDGFGLAWSISEHLITKKNCFCFFATHFHELTQLSEKYNNKVENLHVVAHVENGEQETNDDITLMYKVEKGTSDKSFGIHVAELVKFPSKIVNMAKRKASELQDSNTSDDTYVQNKKSKCSPEEYNKGVEKIKEILKNWKSICYDEKTRECKFESKVAVEKLKDLIYDKYSNDMKNDAFINEIVTML